MNQKNIKRILIGFIIVLFGIIIVNNVLFVYQKNINKKEEGWEKYENNPVLGDELLLDFGETTDAPKKIAYKVEITEVTDINGDGAVDGGDITDIITVMKAGSTVAAADVNGDGAVDGADITAVIDIIKG